MPNVYIPNQSSHDHKDAERYGTVVYVTKGQLSKFATNSMYREWWKALRTSQPDDIILLSSLSTLQCIGCAIFGAMHGRLNLLLWRNDRYMKREILFSDLMEEVQKED
jgi:hypothetical protein